MLLPPTHSKNHAIGQISEALHPTSKIATCSRSVRSPRALRDELGVPAPDSLGSPVSVSGISSAMGVVERFNITESGQLDAQPILFAHGFGCDQHMWRYVAPRFEDHFRVILFDHVGAGKSDLSAYEPERYDSLKAYADDVLTIVHELELSDVIFVGHSVSAMIGVLAAVAEPPRFSKLVLVGPSPRYIDEDSYVGGFSEADISELLDSLESNYLGWSSAMAPVIMGNTDRPELGEELTESFCRTDPQIAVNSPG